MGVDAIMLGLHKTQMLLVSIDHKFLLKAAAAVLQTKIVHELTSTYILTTFIYQTLRPLIIS